MKKLILMVVAAIMATANVNAQVENLRHEVSVAYGTGKSTFGDGIGEGLGLAIGQVLSFGLAGSESYNEKDFGTLSLEYFYHLNDPMIAVGGILGYASTSQDYRDKETKNYEGSRKRNYYTVMPAIKYYWVNKNHIGLYSKGALGVTLASAERKNGNESKTENKAYAAYQLSPIGIEGGIPYFRAFVELGFGEQGVIGLVGLRAKF